ncbi:hypothetical protein KMP13_14550 [Epibacterium ulvae]|uniref:hypothetical protein n=1 Tax=Epibacterium ulvae TaxID=1156985 RepID=UPI001BFC8554|nr:hypothetical protein [Epibacterium ulvae]MBT8155068.1 hypothetical protein [Epibacterium ulvae]
MIKFLAVVNVVAWSVFWAFGYLALSAEGYSDHQILVASLLAAVGLFTGISTYLRLVQASERSGYAQSSAGMTREIRNEAQEKWEKRHELG